MPIRLFRLQRKTQINYHDNREILVKRFILTFPLKRREIFREKVIEIWYLLLSWLWASSQTETTFPKYKHSAQDNKLKPEIFWHTINPSCCFVDGILSSSASMVSALPYAPPSALTHTMSTLDSKGVALTKARMVLLPLWKSWTWTFNFLAYSIGIK